MINIKRVFVILLCLFLWGCSFVNDIQFSHAKVLSVESDRILVQTFDNDNVYDEIYILVSDNTKWENGHMETIQVGDEISICIASEVMQSLPPQVNAMKIICE